MQTSKVAVVRCPEYSEKVLNESLMRLFSFFDGPQSFIQPGQRVLLKPNLIIAATADSGATTHPRVIEALIKMVKQCNAHPYIGDSPAFGSAQGVAQACGIRDVALRYEVPIVELRANKNCYRQNSNTEILDQNLTRIMKEKVKLLSTISQSIHDYDVIINVPKLKAHEQMVFTGATKNIFGCVRGKVKALRHFAVTNNMELFSNIILYMYSRVCPEFTVVDAIDVMEEKGPSGGSVRRRGLLFGGIDGISIDTVIAHSLGVPISEIPILKYAQKYNYGVTNKDHITVMGESDAEMKDFKLPAELAPISFSTKTIIRSVTRHLFALFTEKKA